MGTKVTKSKPDTNVQVTLDAATYKRLEELMAARKARRKYAPNKPEDALEEIVYEAARAERTRENRLANTRRNRLNFRKWWVHEKVYLRLQEIKARIKSEADPEEWGSLNRIDQNTAALTLLLDDFEQADAKRHVPIGAHLGGRQHSCPTCTAPVGEVWLDGEPVRDLNGGLRICALTGTEQFLKAARDLANWTPELGTSFASVDKKIMKSYEANGAEPGTLPPFFSEVFLYDLLGKDAARTLRGMLRALIEAGGIPAEKSWEII